MKFEKVGMALLEYCQENRILKVLLSLDVILLIGSAVINLLGNFISMGSLVNSLAGWIFYLGIILVIARSNYKMLSIGLGIALIECVYQILRSLIKYKSLSWGALIPALIYGFFVYQAYRKSLKIN